MWIKIAGFILKKRIAILLVLAILTIVMGWFALKAEITYEFANLLPANDSTHMTYRHFKKQFGQDGSILFVGMQDDGLYELEKFNAWYDLGNDIKNINGVQDVISVAHLYQLLKNDSVEKIQFIPLLSQNLKDQASVDSIKKIIAELPFYDGLIYNSKTRSTVMAITFDKKKLNNKNRLQIVDEIKQKVITFNENFPGKIHYSGLPYIRTVIAQKIAYEMSLFLALAISITILVLFLFFRSLLPVVFSVLVVILGVIWSFGFTVLFGYKITILSGLIPPLLIIIGIPNCILLLNTYHAGIAKQGNRYNSLINTIEKVGVSLFLANYTTAVGFGVFCFAGSNIFFEFGLVASISVMATYMISLLVIPTVFSFLPAPREKHTKHLENKRLKKIIEKIIFIVHHKRKWIYSMAALFTIIAVAGIFKIKALGYVVDDLPEKDPVLADLKYFEKNFNGVLPLEISIDTKKENGVFSDNGKTLYKINNLYKLLVQYPEFSRPVSVVDAVKYANQALHNGNPKFYRLPGAPGLTEISTYTSGKINGQPSNNTFTDSTKRYARVSVHMADIGSARAKELIAAIKPRIDSVFNYDKENQRWLAEGDKYLVAITGNSVLFLESNNFLVKNLLESVLLAVIIISLILYILFMSRGMIFISVLPSLIPLIITAGLMGYFNLHLKPSTILVFSIAFGIASDATLYFLSTYIREYRMGKSIQQAVLYTIRQTGVSMIYTAIILSCGFGIFAASDFGGTASLGILISFTLVVAYSSNLVLLPAFLLTLDKKISKKKLNK